MSSFDIGKFATNQTFGKNIRRIIEIDNIPIVFDEPLWYRIVENDICLDIFLYLRDKDKLYALGQDALVEGRSELPYFYRAKWFGDLDDGSFITFNDPTLYLDREIRGGWWQLDGSIELANKFIQNLAQKLSVIESNIICYGASAGGYFTLALAGLLQNSKIVADIAQVDLPSSPYKYNVPLLRQAGILKFKDIFYYWSQQSPPKNIYFLMNEKDEAHITSQLSYFLKGLDIHYTSRGNMLSNLYITKYINDDLELRGHSPWEKKSLINFLRSL